VKRGEVPGGSSNIPGIVFHDDGFVDFERDLGPLGDRGQGSGQIGFVHLKIRKLRSCATLRESFLHQEHLLALFPEGNHIALPKQVRGPVDLSAVDQDMAVDNQLSGRQKGGSKSQTINDIIKAALQKTEEIFS
jgi:hypothetical protein